VHRRWNIGDGRMMREGIMTYDGMVENGCIRFAFLRRFGLLTQGWKVVIGCGGSLLLMGAL